MNQTRKKILMLVMTFVMAAAMVFSPLVQEKAYAKLSTRIAFSDPTAKLGETFKVTMKVSALSGGKLGSAKIMLKYDSAYLEFVSGDNAEGGAGSVSVKGQSTTGDVWTYALSFKALQAGKTSITVSDWEISDADAQAAALDKQGSSAVTIEGDAGASINANLSSLKISPGILEPEFAPDVTEYTVLVGAEVEKMAVSAPTADANAKVVISGNSGLQLGENEIVCKVTAQDGKTSRTYTIKVTKQEGIETPSEQAVPPQGSAASAMIDGQQYEIAASFDPSLLPEGYSASTINYNGIELMSGKADDRDVNICYLIGPDGSGSFYVFDGTSGLWSPYAQLTVSQKSIVLVPLTPDVQVPVGFAETSLELNGTKVKGWIWATDTEQKYCVVYGMNAQGQKDFYRYDMTEKTIQRYFDDPDLGGKVEESEYIALAEKYNSLANEFQMRGYIMLALAVVAAILLIAVIALLIISGRRNAVGTPEGEDYEEEDDRPAPRVKEAAPEKKNSDPEHELREKYQRGEEIHTEEIPVIVNHPAAGTPAAHVNKAEKKAAAKEAPTAEELIASVRRNAAAKPQTVKTPQKEETPEVKLSEDVAKIMEQAKQKAAEDDGFEDLEL